jgi:hypothetical protein
MTQRNQVIFTGGFAIIFTAIFSRPVIMAPTAGHLIFFVVGVVVLTAIVHCGTELIWHLKAKRST